MSEPAWVPLGASAPGGATPLVTALPGSPVDGDEVILTDSLTAGTYHWRLRYVAARATNKWVFVGGAPLSAEVATLESRGNTAYGDLATVGPAITLPVAGDYMIGLGCTTAAATSSISLMSYAIGATAAVDADCVYMDRTAGQPSSPWREKRKNGLAAVALTAKYRGFAAGTGTFEARIIRATPIAVGG